jgi:hypothetical protein
MRFTRIVVVIALVAGLAGIAIPAAHALTFLDSICTVETGGVVRVCPDAETGKAYSYQLLGREGCWPFVTFSLPNGQPPPGITLSSSGLLSGVPTRVGTYDFWVRMQDVPGGGGWCGPTDDKSTERTFRITVLQGLQILQRQAALTPGQLNTPYSMQFTTNTGSGSFAVSSGSLPAGLSLSSSGLLSGTPTAMGDYGFKITASSGSHSDTQTYSMSVVQPLTVTRVRSVGEVGIPFLASPSATGGKPTYTWSLAAGTALPAGLRLDTATGAISGTPTVAGKTSFQLVVTDSLGLSKSVPVPFNAVAHLVLARGGLPTAHAGGAYSTLVHKTGGARPFKWSATGLPRGLKLSATTGRLAGTVKAAGTFRVKVSVKDALGATSSRTYLLKVA